MNASANVILHLKQSVCQHQIAPRKATHQLGVLQLTNPKSFMLLHICTSNSKCHIFTINSQKLILKAIPHKWIKYMRNIGIVGSKKMISWHTTNRAHDTNCDSHGCNFVNKFLTIARAWLLLCLGRSNIVYRLMTSFKYCCCMAFVT